MDRGKDSMNLEQHQEHRLTKVTKPTYSEKFSMKIEKEQKASKIKMRADVIDLLESKHTGLKEKIYYQKVLEKMDAQDAKDGSK